MVSRWRDRACFTAYMRSREHQVSHDRIDPALDRELREAVRERSFELHLQSQVNADGQVIGNTQATPDQPRPPYSATKDRMVAVMVRVNNSVEK